MTTSPERISKLNPTISSLLNQTERVDSFVLNLPDNLKYDIPKNISNVFTIFRVKQASTDIETALRPTLEREGDPETIIIVVNDKTIYSQDFVQKMIQKASVKHIVKTDEAIVLTPDTEEKVQMIKLSGNRASLY